MIPSTSSEVGIELVSICRWADVTSRIVGCRCDHSQFLPQFPLSGNNFNSALLSQRDLDSYV